MMRVTSSQVLPLPAEADTVAVFFRYAGVEAVYGSGRHSGSLSAVQKSLNMRRNCLLTVVISLFDSAHTGGKVAPRYPE
jgi:hypothetical protein